MSSNEWDVFFTDSATRPAGYRQALLIAGEEYGFRWIPAGEFDMGSPESEDGRYGDERLHHVKLTKGFWMLETPVTQRLYQSVVGTNPSKFHFSDGLMRRLGSELAELDRLGVFLTRSVEMSRSDLPVESVSAADALGFCKKLTETLPSGLKANLPTEAQWEYACRAGTTTPFSFGSVLNGDKANCDGRFPHGAETKGTYLGKTTPVKSYSPNAWGLYDMHGNVWEWCLDFYEGDFPAGTVVDPKGPDCGSKRVIRGGSWYSYASSCRSANREVLHDLSRSLGFRFILSCD